MDQYDIVTLVEILEATVIVISLGLLYALAYVVIIDVLTNKKKGKKDENS